MKPEKPHRRKHFHPRREDVGAPQLAMGALLVMTILYATTIV
jgi:hypothetical protein